MKRIDLNIKIDDLRLDEADKNKSAPELARRFIDMAFGIYMSEPDARTGRATGLPMSEQRKIYAIMDALDKAVDGMAELQDDHLEYLKKVFDQVKWTGATKAIVRISDKISEAGLQK